MPAEPEPDPYGNQVWGLGGEDPDSSCPPEYAGVPLREIFAEADAREAEPAEAWDAGFLPRDVPSATRSAGPAEGFASGGPLDAAPPDLTVAAFAEEVTGPDGRCAAANDDELIGVLRFWQGHESRTASCKLAVIAELIRRRPAPGFQPAGPGGMPAAWDRFCGDELAAVMACSGQAAEKTLLLAHDLATRLPGTAQALYDGAIDIYKAQIIAEATRVLDAAGSAEAEGLVLLGIGGKTPGQIRVAIARAVITVNPEAARARRERAQKDARVELWREDAGTAALCGRDLPPAEALAADQRITAYARELKAAGLQGTLDQLRARAFLDFTLGVSSSLPPATDTTSGSGADGETSPASTDGSGADGARPADGQGPDGRPPASTGSDPDGASTATPATGNADAGNVDSGDGGSADALVGCTRNGSPDCAPRATSPSVPAAAGPAARINLTIPLATLLGLADRPGDAAGLGPLDPDLARTLATAAATNPRTTWCLTVTDQHGHPAAHGCARPARPNRDTRGAVGLGGAGNRDGPAFTPNRDHGPPAPNGHGRWRLITPGPGGRDYTIDLGPLAITGCDHRHESAGYQPSDKLRHHVEVRDGECTFPPCRRQARNCDFEHAVPYDQGGRTCACNAGARCRRHHQAKQAPGWRLDQHQPGYHTWTTPSGRTYTTGPATYPV